MNKRNELLRLIRELPEEKVTELIWFLEDANNIALEDAEGAEWRVDFTTKALYSFETGEKFEIGRQNFRGEQIVFEPQNQDKKGIKMMQEQSVKDLEDANRRINLLSALKDLFDDNPDNPFTLARIGD